MTENEQIDWDAISEEGKRELQLEALSAGTYLPAIATLGPLIDAKILRPSEVLRHIDALIIGASATWTVPALLSAAVRPLILLRGPVQASADREEDSADQYRPAPDVEALLEQLTRFVQPRSRDGTSD